MSEPRAAPLSCDALVNIPVLKPHMLARLSFATKNHYRPLSCPQNFHHNRINWGLPELNALPPIKDRTCLIIGDVLAACLRYKNPYPYWDTDFVGDSILASLKKGYSPRRTRRNTERN